MIVANPKSTERRENHRKIFRSTGHLRFLGYPPIRIRTFDLTPEGISIIAPVNLPPKTMCALRITIPMSNGGASPLELPVRVMQTYFSGHEDGFCIGMEFGKLTEAAEKLLRQYLHC